MTASPSAIGPIVTFYWEDATPTQKMNGTFPAAIPSGRRNEESQ